MRMNNELRARKLSLKSTSRDQNGNDYFARVREREWGGDTGGTGN
jgi:hypothetical protein